MRTEKSEGETCGGCGKPVAGERVYCHLYPETGPVALCSPACANAFLRGTAGGPATGKSFLEELLERMEWSWAPPSENAQAAPVAAFGPAAAAAMPSAPPSRRTAAFAVGPASGAPALAFR